MIVKSPAEIVQFVNSFCITKAQKSVTSRVVNVGIVILCMVRRTHLTGIALLPTKFPSEHLHQVVLFDTADQLSLKTIYKMSVCKMFRE